MLAYLEDLKLAIDNYILDYFVILRDREESLPLWASFLSFWASAKNPHRKPFGLKPSGWQKRVILSLFYSVILRERKRPKNPIPLLSFLYKTCNKRFLGVLPPRNDKKGRRPFGLRLRVTMWWSFWPWAEALSRSPELMRRVSEGSAKGKNLLLVSPQWFFNYRVPSLITTLCCVYPLIMTGWAKYISFLSAISGDKFFLDKDIIFYSIKMRLAENL